MINPEGLSEDANIRYCNIPWLHNGNMGIMLLLVWRSQGHSGLVGGRGGGGGCPAWKNQRWYPLKFKNQYHFQYDTTKSLSISEVINNNKIINLNSILLIYSHNAFC